MSQKRKDWEELPHRQLERALAGGRRDLDALVRWYGPVVWGAVAARLRLFPALAVQMEDFVGDVWLELCRNDRKRLRYYDPERGAFGYFIRMQASQIAGQLVRRMLRGVEFVQDASAEAADGQSEQRLVDRDLIERMAQKAKAELGESDWLLFRAIYVEGLGLEDAALRLEKKTKTVYQQKYRLREKLDAIARDLLASEGPEMAVGEPILHLLVAGLIGLLTTLCQDELHATGTSSGCVDKPDAAPLDRSR